MFLSHGFRRRLVLAGLLATVALALTGCMRDLTPKGGWAAPVPDGDSVYVGSSDGILSRIIPSGSRTATTAWSFAASPDGRRVIYGTPLVAGDAVYGAAYNCRGSNCTGDVFAVDASTGQPLWAERTFKIATEIVGSPAVSGDTLLIGTSQVGDDKTPGYLIALDARRDADRDHTPREKWRFPVGGRVWGGITVLDGIAYFGAMDGFIYAVDVSDEKAFPSAADREVWRFKAGGAVVARPVITGGRMYIGDFAGHFYALDLDARREDPGGTRLDPAREWSFETESWFWAPALVNDDIVYAATLGGELFALDARTGAPVWAEPGSIRGQIVASPVLIDTPTGAALAVPSGEEDVWVIDTGSGRELGKFDTAAGVKAAPVVINDLIYVYTLKKQLAWFSVADRSARGCLDISSGAQCS